MPTTKKCKETIFNLIPHDVKGPIYELGSGWGTVAFPLAQKYPHLPIKAYELSIVPYMISFVIQKIFGPSNLTFYRQDFLKVDLSDAALVVVYLFPEGMSQLEKKLSPESTVISNTFRLPHRTPTLSKKVDDLYHTVIYLYSHEKK